jgi:hypothetical protein
VLITAGLRRQSTREVPVLAIGSAAGRRRTSKVYLLDAVVELMLVAAWAFVRRRGRRVPLILEMFWTQDETYHAAEALRPASSAEPSREALGV